jgi:hypothetical protein
MKDLFDSLIIKTIKTNLIDNMLKMLINTDVYTEKID